MIRPKAIVIATILLATALPAAFAADGTGCIRAALLSITHDTRSSPFSEKRNPRTRTNGLIFGKRQDIDPSTLAAFVKYQKLDGSITVPPNLRLSMAAHYEGNTWPSQVSFDTGSIRAQKRDLRSLFRDIKTRSKADSTTIGREYGAMVVEYVDGTSQVIKFTSSHATMIRFEDTAKAWAGSGVFEEGRTVKRVIHIHTHPDPQRLGMNSFIPSDNDYQAMAELENKHIRHWGPEGPAVQGIVLPNCATCDDLFLGYTADGVTRASREVRPK